MTILISDNRMLAITYLDGPPGDAAAAAAAMADDGAIGNVFQVYDSDLRDLWRDIFRITERAVRCYRASSGE